MLPPETNRSLTHAFAAAAALGLAAGAGAIGHGASACDAGEPCAANGASILFVVAGAAAAGFAVAFLPCVVFVAARSSVETNLLLARRAIRLATAPAVIILVLVFGVAVLDRDAHPGTSRGYWLAVGTASILLALLPAAVGPRRWKVFVPVSVLVAIAALAWAWYLFLPAFLLIPYATLVLVAAITAAAVPARRRRGSSRRRPADRG